MYDVIVIGGGIVGATLACALSRPADDSGQRRPLSVALIEGGDAPSFAAVGEVGGDDYDLRVSAISPAARRLFEHLALWPRIAGTRVCPFRSMRIWDATGSGRLVIDAAEAGLADMGHIVENRLLRTAAWEGCQANGTDVFTGRRLSGIAVHEDFVESILEDGEVLRAKLIVGADGGRSPTRTLLSLPVSGREYDQHCIVGTMRPARHHEYAAWQRFRPQGPVAFLPLAAGFVSIAWYESPARCRELLEAPDDVFADALAEATDHALGEIEHVGRHASFPLRYRHARRYVCPRGALVGDAAHVLHPMAGQGVNLGLLDAAALAEVVLKAATAGRDIGGHHLLRRYERWRRGDNLVMMTAIDGLKRLYESPALPLRLFRNSGMNLVDALAPAKQLMMRQALGEYDDLPSLVK